MDYAPIALQATDVLVDKHFHRIPDKAFRKETYKPRIPFKNSRRRRREEEERRNSRDQGQYQDERRNSRDSRNQEDRDSGVQRQEEPYRDPEIEEAGYGSEPDYTSRQRERNMRDRDWDSREKDRDFRDIPRHSGAGVGGGTGYGYGNSYEESNHSNTSPHPIYSQQPPRLRPEYLPKYAAPSKLGSDNRYPYYFPPPHISSFSDSFGRDEGERDYEYDSDERYAQERTRRPKPIQRRSSYDDIHNQRNAPSNTDQRLSKRDTQRRPRSSHSTQASASASHQSKESHMENIKDRADRYGVKSEAKGLFTDSSKGLAGGAIGWGGAEAGGRKEG
ncbi:f2c48842-4a27-42c3-b982-908b5c676c54-CDS [Sclerotinia trifoliorum]|uniref:F2c48842-4a27-42c3-b982-908b5c676c54-CDS n=1 Tax=Sclerotinia trifoliorum TaxID=28548 RepID=A0A8H2ZUT3_9HELO|nr:f2c48842-4a27-42c3-b982-908b5c676c54-CDS [Sclerotinia trifoliorum]